MKDPNRPPSSRQLEYAKSLGVKIPESATFDLVSDLITLKAEQESPAPPKERKIAESYGVQFTEYATSGKIFSLVDQKLLDNDDPLEIAKWYTFWVYHDIQGQNFNAPIQSPNEPMIVEIAKIIIGDERILKSIKRHMQSFGSIRAFGELLSRGAIGYKEVASKIKDRIGVDKKIRNPNFKDDWVDDDDDETDVRTVTYDISEPAKSSTNNAAMMGLFVFIAVMIALAVMLSAA